MEELNFFEKVYQVVRKIPYGRVSSYGLIAEHLGTKGSARMVGWAMNAAHSVIPPVPAHRVVNRNGLLSGKHHFATEDLMQEMLESEGVKIIDNKIINFKNLVWNPNLELTTD